MRQIDVAKLSAGKEEPDGLQKIVDGFKSLLAQLGITLEGEADAAETVVRRLNRMLDNRYTMLQHVALPGETQRIPLVLVGPPGVVVINPRSDTGVFRAREATWVVMNRRSQTYEEARENLLEQTDALAQMMVTYLRQSEITVTEVQPLLVLASPGAHVESSRPIVRILPIDALDRYIATLTQGQGVLSVDEAQALVKDLSKPPAEPVMPEPEVVEKPKKTTPPLSGQIDLPPMLAKFNMSKRQWILIAVMGGLEFILLIFLILYVFLNS